RLRKSRPDLAFSSDFIVGFPGETEAHFSETMQLVAEVQYASAFSFAYSARPGTPAANDDNQVEEAVKHERLQRLQGLLRHQQLAFNASCVGREMDVLFDRPGKREGQVLGKSPYLQSVHVENASHVQGSIARVSITGGFANSLSAELVSHPLRKAS
ncbi:MAG: TRAM domain-containing protein, partial [Rickettsiales bacterium]|nr:TRAM domain-containing protein [Rickettsiales bacterium]